MTVMPPRRLTILPRIQGKRTVSLTALDPICCYSRIVAEWQYVVYNLKRVGR